jgi:hypothetical protein
VDPELRHAGFRQKTAMRERFFGGLFSKIFFFFGVPMG